MIAQVAQGIATKYSGSALATLLTGGLWREKAKDDVAFPYAVFTEVDDINGATYASDVEFHRIQFTIWAQYTSAVTDAQASLDVLEASLRSLFDRAKLTITSWNNPAMLWDSSRPAYSEDDTIVGTHIDFVTWIDKTR